MLSSSTIKNIDQAAFYYSAEDNYYTKEEGLENSEWYGKLADEFKLEGQINTEKFIELLEGKLGNGQQIGKYENGIIKHRPGWDLTFSAPKSVSILGLIGGDSRLIDAHRKAVKFALSLIEKDCAQARSKIDGEICYSKTGNLVSALFHHDLSRAKDPQLHTHSVIMNLTKRADGKILSLASSNQRYNENQKNEINGFIEKVRNNNRYYCKVYEAQLAYQVQKLGYKIHTDTNSRVFEIEGITREAIEHFSKRRVAIEKRLDEKGFKGGKAASIATLDTRPKKESVNRDSIKSVWDSEVERFNLNLNGIIEATTKTTPVIDIKNKRTENAVVILNEAIAQLSLFDATFSKEALLEKAAAYAIQSNVGIKELIHLVDEQIDNGGLIANISKRGKTMLIAKHTLENEENLLKAINTNQSLANHNDKRKQQKYFAKTPGLDITLQNSIKEIFSSSHIKLIERNKYSSELIEQLIRYNNAQGKKSLILSPSIVGLKDLTEKVIAKPSTLWEQIKAVFVNNTPKNATIAQFVNEISNYKDNKNARSADVIYVDNANLLSTVQKLKLIEHCNDNNVQLILIGNKKNLLPYYVSNSLEELSQAGIKTIIYKQEDQANSLKSVKASDIAKSINEYKHSEDRTAAMAADFSRLDIKTQRKSWLVTYSKSKAIELNSATHLALKANHKVHDCNDMVILVPVFIEPGLKNKASSYSKGQYIRFNESIPSLGIHKGQYLQIIEKNDNSNRVILQGTDSAQIIWRPDLVGYSQKHKTELFNVKNIDVGINDFITLSRSIPNKKLQRGERLQVLQIDKLSVAVSDSSGRTHRLDLSKHDHTHFDYGYCDTMHNLAYAFPEIIIADMPSSKLQTNQRKFSQLYAQCSKLHIYTDDIEKLALTLSTETGNRVSAQEILVQQRKIKEEVNKVFDQIELTLKKNADFDVSASMKIAIDAIQYAVSHLSEREAAFKFQEIFETSLKHSLGSVNFDHLQSVIKAFKENKILLENPDNTASFYTTAEAVAVEREIIALTKNQKELLNPISRNQGIHGILKQKSLSNEQVDTINQILISQQRNIVVEGWAGTGKTTLFKSLADVVASKDLCNGESYRLLGIAPTNKAVKELKSRGIESQTVDSFLREMKNLSPSKDTSFANTLLIIDEASMISNNKMLQVLKIAHDKNFCRTITTGDTYQNPAIEAGKPFSLMLNNIEHAIVLKNIQRQKNIQIKNAALALYEGNVAKSFSYLKDMIFSEKEEVQVKNGLQNTDKTVQNLDRFSAIVADYMLQKHAGIDVQIIAPSNEDRKILNQEIRKLMHEAGELDGVERDYAVYASLDMSNIEKSRSSNYKIANIIKFISSEDKRIKAGEYYVVKDIVRSSNLLVLHHLKMNKKPVFFELPQNNIRLDNIQVFSAEKRKLQAGDRIIWTNTNKEINIVCAEFAKVLRVEENQITIKDAENMERKIEANDPQFKHWDHGYALTTYSTQGGTYQSVLAFFESYRRNLMNVKTLLVTVTRAVDKLRIYTDDVENLIENISANTGDKAGALEAIGEVNETQKSQYRENVSSGNKIADKPQENTQQKKILTEQIIKSINHNAEEIAIQLLGKPKVRGSNFLKFGSNQGSLSLTIKGEKQGWWYDYSEGKGGKNMLSFIMNVTNLKKQDAITYAAQLVNIPLEMRNNVATELGKQLKKRNKNNDSISPDSPKFTAKLAETIVAQSFPAKDTIVEKYLNSRGIICDQMPDEIRFHPNLYSKINGKSYPAMIALVHNIKSELTGIQATFIDPVSGAKIAKDQLKVQKQSFGKIKESAVRIDGKDGAPTIIAEGVETALSIKMAMPETNIIVTLSKSNLKTVTLPDNSSKVVFVLDYDGKPPLSDSTIAESIIRVMNQNKTVSLMIPAIQGKEKMDFNDVLQQRGPVEIQRCFENRQHITEKKLLDYHPKFDNSMNMAVNKLGSIIEHAKKNNAEKLLEAYRTVYRNSYSADAFHKQITTKEIEQSK